MSKSIPELLILILAVAPISAQSEVQMSAVTNYSLEQAQKKLAKIYFNKVWGYLEQTDRSPEDDEAMLHAVHTSCYLWMQVGTPLNHQRGEWQIARVYSVLGLADSALRHANRCLELTQTHRELMQDFDIAFAYECVARANAIAGNVEMANKYITLAEAAANEIKDKDDRKVFMDDFNGEPW